MWYISNFTEGVITTATSRILSQRINCLAIPYNRGLRDLGLSYNNNSKYGFFYTSLEAMLKSKFTKKEIIKIGGGNYCRIFDKATSV